MLSLYQSLNSAHKCCCKGGREMSKLQYRKHFFIMFVLSAEASFLALHERLIESTKKIRKIMMVFFIEYSSQHFLDLLYSSITAAVLACHLSRPIPTPCSGISPDKHTTTTKYNFIIKITIHLKRECKSIFFNCTSKNGRFR